MSNGEFERSPELWYDDGTVVLQADKTLFKVYKGILSRESSLFRDMFSLPQPATGVEMYEGCQLLKIHDDAAQMSLFLLALFSSYDFLLSQCTCVQYTAILRVAMKYQADDLRKRILSILQRIYPDTLEGWEEVNRTGEYYPSTNLLHRLPLDDLDAHIAVINLAQQDADAEAVLPAAMLRLFQRDMDVIVDAARTSGLDAARVLEVLPAMSALARTHTFALLFSGDVRLSDDCRSVSSCFAVRRKFLIALERPGFAYVADPFARVKFAQGKLAFDLCGACRRVFQASYEAGRETAWEALPACFKLGSWDTLRRRITPVEGEEEGAPITASF